MRHGAGSREQGAGSGSLLRAAVPRPRQPLALAMLALAAVATTAAAQVGHDPAHSPYRDIRRGSGLLASVGWLGGDRGSVPVGPGPGTTLGLHYSLAGGGPVVLLAGATFAALDRYVIDPDSSAATRRSGPEPNDILQLDVGIQLRLTGGKSWRGIAPYLGMALGLAFELRGPNDPGNYTFGTKFTLAPGAGLRIHPARRLTVVADVRYTFWRLGYPTTYRVANAVDSTTVLPAGASETDWTTHPSLRVGVGWTF